MSFIKATTNHKATIINVWRITKVNNDVVYTETDSPFRTSFNNGYIDITDIFGRHFLLNSNHCIDMLETQVTKIEDNNKIDFYEGTPEIRTNYTCSDDYATPIKLNQNKNICG